MKKIVLKLFLFMQIMQVYSSDNEHKNNKSILFNACDGKFSSLIKAFFVLAIGKIDANVTMNDCTERTLLHYAANHNRCPLFEMIMFMCSKKYIPVNSQDGFGYTPLHIVTKANNTKRARQLLKIGADVNLSDYYNKSALHYAVKNSAKITQTLVKAGADVNKISDQGTPLHCLVDRDWFSSNKDVDLIEKGRILIGAGALVNLVEPCPFGSTFTRFKNITPLSCLRMQRCPQSDKSLSTDCSKNKQALDDFLVSVGAR